MLKLYKSIDATSASCTGPIGELAGAMGDALPGEGIEIFVKDESTRNDVLSWVKKTGNKVAADEKLAAAFRLVVEKAK